MSPDTPPLPPPNLPAAPATPVGLATAGPTRPPLRPRARQRRTLRILGIAGGVIAVAAIAYALLRRTPTRVEVGLVTTGVVRVSVSAEGLTHIVQRHVLVAPVTAVLRRIALRAGDAVHDGDVVARLEATREALLDPRARELGVQRLGAASATLAQLRANATRTMLARAQQARELDRMRRLEAGGALAPQQLESQASTVAQLTEDAVAADAAAHAAEHDVAAARAALEGFARSAPSNSVAVTSPMDGVVLRVLHEDEGVVSAGTPLLEVGAPASTEVITDVLSEDAARLQVGAPARVFTPDGDTVGARVQRIEPQAFTRRSSLGVDEQRVHVSLRLLTPGGPPGALGDAYRVETEIDQGATGPGTIRVPAAALVRRGDAWAVFVVRNDRAVLVPVTVGLRNARHAAILRGLSAGERVILYPSDTVSNGIRVSTRAT